MTTIQKLRELLRRVDAGTHVLVRLFSEGNNDGDIYVVPKAVFTGWKKAMAAAGDDWPAEISASLDEHLTYENRLPVERWVSTMGDCWGLADRTGNYGRETEES